MDDDLEAADRRPASRRVAELLRADIETGKLPVGARLPSYRSLMAEHGIALNTAQAAIRLLEQEGWLVVRQARGAYVIDRGTPVPPELQLHEVRAELRDLRDQLRDAGGTVSKLEQRVSALVDRLGGATD